MTVLVVTVLVVTVLISALAGLICYVTGFEHGYAEATAEETARRLRLQTSKQDLHERRN